MLEVARKEPLMVYKSFVRGRDSYDGSFGIMTKLTKMEGGL